MLVSTQTSCLRRSRRRFVTLGWMIFVFAGLFCSVPLPLLHAQTYTPLHFFSAAEGGAESYPAVLAQGRDGNLYGTTAGGGGSNCCGSVFRMTPSGTLTIIYNFSGPDGQDPRGGLTLGTDGNFYGTTEYGGTHSIGTIFQITPTGTLKTLYNFTGSTDGDYPLTAPVQGKNGAFYGVTFYGRTYSITSSGTFKALPGSIVGPSYGALLLANDGNFYGTSLGGGSYGSVFRLSASGAVTTIYKFDNTHGASPYGTLVQGSDGFLYGTTEYGGTATNAAGVVFKLSTKGQITVLHSFDGSGSTDGFNLFAGLVAASDGNRYGTTAAGPNSPGYGVLFRISESGAYSIFHDFDGTQGESPYPTPMQHTNGLVYGITAASTAGGGVVYSYNNSLAKFASLMTTSGTAGQTVEILGTGLTGTTAVRFGGGSASFTVVSDTDMTAVIPANGTSGFVTVTTPGGTLNSNKTFAITPVISSLTPASGPVGTTVTITGTGFVGATQVTFGGVKATSFTVNSGGTKTTAKVPTGAVTGKIAVKTAGGTGTSKSSFTVN